REHGTGKQIEGDDVKGKKVLVVEDVTTSGGSVVKTIEVLRRNQAVVDKVLAVVDRESGAMEKLQRVNVVFSPLLTISDILKK
ncbi:MAG: orotate phosphoribosyltransferase, partial [Thermoplasmata archaeon]